MSNQTALTSNTIGVVLTGSTATTAAFTGAINAALTIGAIGVIFTLPLREPASVVQTARPRRLGCTVSVNLAIDAATNRTAFGDVAVADTASIVSAGPIG